LSQDPKILELSGAEEPASNCRDASVLYLKRREGHIGLRKRESYLIVL
jgi:hypothetical protein